MNSVLEAHHDYLSQFFYTYSLRNMPVTKEQLRARPNWRREGELDREQRLMDKLDRELIGKTNIPSIVQSRNHQVQ